MYLYKVVLTSLVAGTLLLAPAACERKGTAERGGEKVDEGLKRTEERAKEVGKDIERGAERAGERVEEFGERAKERAQEEGRR